MESFTDKVGPTQQDVTAHSLNPVKFIWWFQQELLAWETFLQFILEVSLLAPHHVYLHCRPHPVLCMKTDVKNFFRYQSMCKQVCGPGN